LNWVQQAVKFDKLCHATQLWQGSDSNIILLLCQTKWRFFIYFGGFAFPWGVRRRIATRASVTPEFASTLTVCLNQSHISFTQQLNLTVIKFDIGEAQHLNWANMQVMLHSPLDWTLSSSKTRNKFLVTFGNILHYHQPQLWQCHLGSSHLEAHPVI